MKKANSHVKEERKNGEQGKDEQAGGAGGLEKERGATDFRQKGGRKSLTKEGNIFSDYQKGKL